MGKRIKSPDNMVIGDGVRRYRERLEMSRDELAERLGLSASYIADVERGTVGISIATLKSLCAVLSVSADALVFGEPVGIDSLLRDADCATVEQITELVQLQLKIIKR